MNNEDDSTVYSVQFGDRLIEADSFEDALKLQEAIINATQVDILKRVG